MKTFIFVAALTLAVSAINNPLDSNFFKGFEQGILARNNGENAAENNHCDKPVYEQFDEKLFK